MIEIKELTKVYRSGMRKGGVTALDGVSFTIDQGEIFGLLGPNGAGKTTLMKVLLDLVRPTTGSVAIGGLPPSDPRSRQSVGFLPENHRFPEYHTARSLLHLTGRLYGMSPADITRRAGELLELVGMARWADMQVRKYSKGMAQRIGLAQALMSDPEILLLDEPTDGVDPVGRVEIRNVLEKVRSEGKLILLNSHLLAEVETVANRVAILSKGKLVRVGSVEMLTRRRKQYEFEADMGNKLVELPEEVGKLVAVTDHSLLVELVEDEHVNYVIDQLRIMKVSIRAIKPLRVSLEQSFLEAVAETPEAKP